MRTENFIQPLKSLSVAGLVDRVEKKEVFRLEGRDPLGWSSSPKD